MTAAVCIPLRLVMPPKTSVYGYSILDDLYASNFGMVNSGTKELGGGIKGSFEVIHRDPSKVGTKAVQIRELWLKLLRVG